MIDHVLFPISVKTRVLNTHKNSLNEAFPTSPHKTRPIAEVGKLRVSPSANMRLKGS